MVRINSSRRRSHNIVATEEINDALFFLFLLFNLILISFSSLKLFKLRAQPVGFASSDVIRYTAVCWRTGFISIFLIFFFPPPLLLILTPFLSLSWSRVHLYPIPSSHNTQTFCFLFYLVSGIGRDARVERKFYLLLLYFIFFFFYYIHTHFLSWRMRRANWRRKTVLFSLSWGRGDFLLA